MFKAVIRGIIRMKHNLNVAINGKNENVVSQNLLMHIISVVITVLSHHLPSYYAKECGGIRLDACHK